MRLSLNLEVCFMSGYNTEQRKILIDFMSKNSEIPFTIEELIIALQNDTNIVSVPGRSTVYRLMNKLVEEGVVKRFVKGHSRHFHYQIVASHHCHDHIHMKCTKCGKLYHMDNAQTEKILCEVLSSMNFAVDKEETTLYGLCKTCHVTP